MKSSCLLATIVAIAMLFAGCGEAPDQGLGLDLSPLSKVDTSGTEPRNPVVAERPVASETGPWPAATTEDTEYPFGKMSVGTELDHTFRIGNSGDSELVLQPGKPTCKCTAFEIKPSRIQPGEFADLLVRWKGKFKDAKFRHGGLVYTNDPDRPEIHFSVMGIVDANLDVLPEETWSVGEVTSSTPGVASGYVLSRVHDDFQVTDVKCESPYVKTEIIAVSEEELEEYQAARAFKIKVTVDQSMPPGTLEEKLTITADCEKDPVTVTVVAHKTGPIRILPMAGVLWSEKSGVLRLGQFSMKAGGEAGLMLLTTEEAGAEPLEFTDVSSSPSYLDASLERLGAVGADKARYKMTVRIPPGLPQTARGPGNPGTIDIKTNHPSGQSLRIKVIYKTLF